MSEDAKHFILGLKNSQTIGGMRWHGRVPKEIKELFDLPSDFRAGYILNVMVEVAPRSELFKPEWEK